MSVETYGEDVNLAVVGATGLVGENILDKLYTRGYRGGVRTMASERSAGRTVTFGTRELVVEDAATANFEDVDYALCSLPDADTETVTSKIAEQGALVIDNSRTWRQDPEVPLVVAEVNPQEVRNTPKNIIANPNCTTMIGMVAIYPLHTAFGLESISANTYQSVSGQGRQGISEFLSQMADLTPHADKLVRGEMTASDLPRTDIFPTVLPYNVGPLCGVLKNPAFEGTDDGTSEEHKFERESRKILGLGELPGLATCVRVPVLNGHSLAIDVSFAEQVKPHQAARVLRDSPGVQLSLAPQPIYAAGKDDVQVGRLREDPTHENGLKLFVSGDNLLKGAALNAVQIAELLIK